MLRAKNSSKKDHFATLCLGPMPQLEYMMSLYSRKLMKQRIGPQWSPVQLKPALQRPLDMDANPDREVQQAGFRKIFVLHDSELSWRPQFSKSASTLQRQNMPSQPAISYTNVQYREDRQAIQEMLLEPLYGFLDFCYCSVQTVDKLPMHASSRKLTMQVIFCPDS